MLEGLDTGQRIEFVSKYDKSEPKTTFILKPLSGIEMIDMSGMISGNTIKLDADNIFKLLSNSIVEIKNFDGMVDKDEIIHNLSVDVLTELTEKIGEINRITESGKKK